MKKWNILVNKLNSLEAQLSSNKTKKNKEKIRFLLSAVAKATKPECIIDKHS